MKSNTSSFNVTKDIIGKAPNDEADPLRKIVHEIKRARVLYDDEIKRLEEAALDPEYTAKQLDAMKGTRIMYLFQRDMLPQLEATILESKTERDGYYNEKLIPIGYMKKMTYWSIIISMNIFMLT